MARNYLLEWADGWCWVDDLRDWAYTFKIDTQIMSSLVSSTRLRPRIKILESRDWDFFLFFLRDRDWDENFHISETETCMSLKLETLRERDFSIFMTYIILYRELKFLLRQIYLGLLTVGDDEHAIE